MHARLTALARPEHAPAGLSGMLLLSAPRNLSGLTPRELQVLGLLIQGRSSDEIARGLAVTPRTVAAHLRRIGAKLSTPTPTPTPTPTLAALRAERDGLYVPPRTGAPPQRP